MREFNPLWVTDNNMEPDERTEIDPAEYFNPEAPVPAKSFLGKIWFPGIFAGAGVGMGSLINVFNRRPPFSGEFPVWFKWLLQCENLLFIRICIGQPVLVPSLMCLKTLLSLLFT